jgi:Spy/CpxP family protein refolding chaperone
MILAAAHAVAQGGPDGEHHKMGDRMAKELNLTADQQAKMKQIMQQDHASMKAIRDDQSLTKEQRQAKMQSLHESMKKDVDAILTPEQRQKMVTLHAQHGGEMGGNPGDRIAKKLNLSADQKTKVENIMESTHQQMSAIREDQSLSQPDKQAKIKQLHESTKSQVNALLTPDQQQKFAKMHDGMGPGGHKGHGHHKGGPDGQEGQGAQTPPPGV